MLQDLLKDALVLVVDDKADIRALVKEQLRRGDIRSETAATTAEAMERIARGDIDLAVVDVCIHVPRDGLELADNIYGMDPMVAIVFLTGDLDALDDYPHARVVKKPHKARTLVLTVRDELIRKRTIAMARRGDEHAKDEALHSPSIFGILLRDTKNPVARVLLPIIAALAVLVGGMGYAFLKGWTK